ncbi:DUF3576 domain-containing protein [Alphaproteobacteria bacterium]|nr:DUF3576 domain-containing protein [Alphaproteobacteria bacterium]
MLRILSLLILTQFMVSCTGVIGGKYQKNLEKFDKIYGYCDNPHRGMNKSSVEYKNCKRKEMAAGADGIIDDEAKMPFENLFNKSRQDSGSIIMANINKDLWAGSLETLNDYSLKIADSMGGYIETDWIYGQNIQDERCSIKVKILSRELVSNGVDVNFICQKLVNNNWILIEDDFIEEEKRLHLKILENAQLSSSSNL